ncbi:MAG TPA: methyltransferase domain-containing protein [Thermomicrobiales bacterium]|nr:methyltransferase domain-containing protein [Thermomicrobiales bacterium]
MPEASRTAFGEVDRTGDPGGFVRYLDTTRATAFFREVKERSYAALDLRPGLRALDLGCGTGEDGQALARAVGPGGWAVGVDVSATMLVEARRRAAGLPVVFCRADAHRLPFAGGAFDRCRAERVLQHVEDPGAVLAELVRVTRPGGRVAIWESELEMLVLDVDDRAVGRKLEHAICDGFRHGAIGHRLYRLFNEAGLVDVEATPLSRAITDYALADAAFQFRAVAERAVAAGIVTLGEAAAWLASLAAACDAGHFLCGVAGFLVSGRKP